MMWASVGFEVRLDRHRIATHAVAGTNRRFTQQKNTLEGEAARLRKFEVLISQKFK